MIFQKKEDCMLLPAFGKLLPLLLTGILCLTSGNVPAGEASRQSPAQAGNTVSLRDTVQGVLRHHRALKSAKEEQRALRQDLRQAQAGFGPRVDVAGETGAGVMNDATARAAQMERDWLSVNTLSAQLVQPIWDGFATRSRVRMAQSALDAASARVLDTSTNLALNAIAAHIDLLRSMRLCELARANVRRHEEILGQAHERLALGADSQADVTQAQSRLSRAQSSLAEAEAGLRTAQATYTRLTGLRASRLEEAALPAGMPDSVAALLALAEKHNPALAACLHDIRRARGEKELQESGMYPSFQLEAGPAYSDRGGRNERWVSSFDVLATMRWNLFNSGADAAAVRAASARERAARQNFYDYMDSLRLDMESTWNSYQAAREQYARYSDAVAFNRQTCQAYHQQFLLGTRSLLDVLDSETELYTSSSQAETARGNILIGAYRLVALAGDLLPRLKIPEDMLLSDPAPAPQVPGEEHDLGWFK